jgi:hypothetical protein
MLFQAYLRRGIVYVPTMARREGGAYTGIEPVALVPVTNAEGIRRSLSDAIARKNITVPVPKGKWPQPILLKYAGVKTWSAFARDADIWTIEEKNRNYQIQGYQMHRKGYWEPDPNQKIDFAAGTAVDTVIDRLIEILQDTAQRRHSSN